MKVDVKSIDRKVNLPSPPVVIQKLQECVHSSDMPYHEIAHIIETDQAFTARILRLVNSPFYGFVGKITSVEEAITMLGLNTVHQLLLTTSLLNTIKINNKAIDISRFWFHSFGVGVLAKHLLIKKSKDVRNDGFLGGILHDIGRLIFVQLDTIGFEKLYASKNEAITLEVEQEYFGVDHQKMGETLAQKWNFPENITNAIAFHHTPEDINRDIALVSAVHVADILSHAMSIGDSGSYYVTKFYQPAWAALEVTYDELEAILKKASTEIDDSKDLLSEIGK